MQLRLPLWVGLSVVASGLAVVPSSVAVAGAVEASSSPMVEAPVAAVEPGQVDDPLLRDRFSTAWVEEDGSITREVYAAPVNFRVDGVWMPIENSWEATDRAGFARENGANSFDVLIPADAGSRPVRVEQAGSWVSFGTVGADGAPSVSASASVATMTVLVPRGHLRALSTV